MTLSMLVISLYCEFGGLIQLNLDHKRLQNRHSQGRLYTPPPRENITKIIRPGYFCVIFGDGYGKICVITKN